MSRGPTPPGAGRSDPDCKGAWHCPADAERPGEDLRHRDRIEGPGHVHPGHVRAGDFATPRQLGDDFHEEVARPGSSPGIRPSRPSSGSGQSKGHGGSSWSPRTRWSRSTAGGTGSCQDRSLHEQTGLPPERMVNTVLKTPAKILVHPGPEKGRLYFFPPHPFFRGIIHKKAEPGRNNQGFSGGNT